MSRDLRPFAQWPKPKSEVPAPSSVLTTVVIDADGDWAETDDPSAVADGVYVTDSDGDPAIDDDPDASPTLRARRIGGDFVTY